MTSKKESIKYPQLVNLLKLDDQYSDPSALADSFGDRFIYSHNYVFRNIRDLVLKAGYRFDASDEMNSRCGPYTVLQKIIDTKTIPYMPTFKHLSQLQKTVNGPLIFDHVLQGLTNYNPTLHESAHGICHTLLPPSRDPLDRSHSAQILKHHLGEAFALTSEVMASQQTNSRIHDIFFHMNSHRRILSYKVSNKDLKLKLALFRLQDSHGFAHVFKLIMITYLYSLCLYQNIGAQEKNRIRQVIKLHTPWDIEEKLALEHIVPFTYSVKPQFRIFVSELYFKIWGINEDIEKLHSFEPLLVLRRDEELLQAIDQLSDLALNGLKSPFSVLLQKTHQSLNEAA